jgi:hypothetical protein
MAIEPRVAGRLRMQKLKDLLRAAGSPADDYRLVSALFLRLLSLIYLAAFASIGLQITGLAGAEGILPYPDTLERVEAEFGVARFWLHPSLFWIHAGDRALQLAAVAGCVFAILLFFNRAPRMSLVFLYLLYLSLSHAGQLFMNFQWDYLLLEAGFLAIFLPGCARFVIWLYRWLLFRFRFLSGAAKLLSQDPTWANLTALTFYFEVQPLPHAGAWYAHQLPAWLLISAALLVLFIELVVPFMMFLSRRPRFFAAWATLALQVAILLTSNHNFFNLLTMVLCLFLFDDRAVRRVLPAGICSWLLKGKRERIQTGNRPSRTALAVLLTAVFVTLGVFQAWEMFAGRRSPGPVAFVLDQIRGFRVINKYHVFPTMKTERLELLIEGSSDGSEWKPYIFRYKPGDLLERPQIVVPHQPRLDWMMWFVPPRHPLNLMWFDAFLQRLLQNSPQVTQLLKTNPFPEEPPRYLRVTLYRYRFTDSSTRENTGQWWEREYLGPFFPFALVTRLPAESEGLKPAP